MSKVFECQRCKCRDLFLDSCVYRNNAVIVDKDENIIYIEDENENEYEEYHGYTCADCGLPLSIDGIIIDNENDLKKYLEIYGIEEVNTQQSVVS